MNALRDALGAVLFDLVAFDKPMPFSGSADAILSDPAFRAALVESVAEALEHHAIAAEYIVGDETPAMPFLWAVNMPEVDLAAAIVARMLGEDRP